MSSRYILVDSMKISRYWQIKPRHKIILFLSDFHPFHSFEFVENNEIIDSIGNVIR